MIGMTDRHGSLCIERVADITVLNDERGRFIQRDNEDHRAIAERLLQPAFCLRKAATDLAHKISDSPEPS